MIIGIDFDGSCVTHAFPNLGEDIGAVPVLQALCKAHHQLILWTMRSNNYLEEAVHWFEANGITLFGVNENPEQRIWTSSPKAHCQLYIDDAALGAPLKMDVSLSDRPFLDWVVIEQMLRKSLIL